MKRYNKNYVKNEKSTWKNKVVNNFFKMNTDWANNESDKYVFLWKLSRCEQVSQNTTYKCNLCGMSLQQGDYVCLRKYITDVSHLVEHHGFKPPQPYIDLVNAAYRDVMKYHRYNAKMYFRMKQNECKSTSSVGFERISKL
jgi:hypothetical protein